MRSRAITPLGWIPSRAPGDRRGRDRNHAGMLARLPHPNGHAWTCACCLAKTEGGWVCDACHTVLCDACQPKPHGIPAGPKQGLLCNGVSASPLLEETRESRPPEASPSVDVIAA